MGVRLHKFLSECGVGARRWCEALIERGEISVNGCVVTKLGTIVEPECDSVIFRGKRVVPQENEYLALYKPIGVVCSCKKDSKYQRVIDLIPENKKRLFHVGRLDVDSEGLILLTNDGEFSHIITHPSFEIVKEYQVWLNTRLTKEEVDCIASGVPISDEHIAHAIVKKTEPLKKGCVVYLELVEGKNREIRKLFGRLHKKVLRLRRLRIGPVQLGSLSQGQYRPLTEEEVSFFKKMKKE
ncbi:MAG: pseudouridine synthase [Candidatus Auribacterota bacterium]|jgi:pseudouridine synthase|uniref:Pseudouridine synthase n=1 Tax=Candidatus Auribacter fodinae TaxID=2093366 RepID=A0A3A4R937_9BACT|nr:MAG: rRNA pseudouridine synthase [Candidatus Auribacter fodinae]